MEDIMVLAHLGPGLDASTPLWLAWNLEPSLILGFAALLGLYFYAAGPLRRRFGWAERIEPRQIAAFVAGVVILILALMSPLDALGDEYLFSAHMVQHTLIALVAPPLLLLGTPGWMIEALLRPQAVRWVVRWLAYPVVAFGLFNADLWLWHVPALYDATLQNELIHIVEHLTFIGFGIIFWLPILSPTPLIPRISRMFGVLYLFLACQPMVALGALLTFAAAPFYEPYVFAPRIWGLDPLTDQQLGGLIMWLPTNIPYLIGLSVLFFRWVGDQDRAERAAAGEYDEETSLPEAAVSDAPVAG
jgi:putative membrane protein